MQFAEDSIVALLLGCLITQMNELCNIPVDFRRLTTPSTYSDIGLPLLKRLTKVAEKLAYLLIFSW